MVWREVIEALEEILDDYERVNHLISLYQDERLRRRGAEHMKGWGGVLLDLGSGPGNFTTTLRKYSRGMVIGLDFSAEMLRIAKKRVRGPQGGVHPQRLRGPTPQGREHIRSWYCLCAEGRL